MFWKRRKSADFRAEIESHLAHEADDLAEEGKTKRDAGFEARRTFGNVAAAQERFYESSRWIWFEQFTQDSRYGLRMLRRSPGFTLIAVLSLALGIGANTAVFSLVDAVMLKSLPVRNPEQLRVLNWIWEGDAPLDSHSGYRARDPVTGRHISGSFSYAAYQAFRRNVPQFSGLMAYARQEFNVTANGSSEIAYGHFVSGNYFTGLGAQPLIGRPILNDDDAAGRPRVVILSYRYWEKRFALDPSIVGRDIAINQKPVTVVGVMPPGFQGLYPGRSIDLFLPMALDAELGPRWFSLTDPQDWWVQIFGRLRPGASDRAAEATLQATLAHTIESYAKQAQAPPILLRPGARGVGLLRQSASNSLSILGVVVSLVLLIACLNLANLLVARSTSRRREIAVRLSIGAGTGRLIRQLLTESLLLGGIGGILGLLVAGPLLKALLPLVAGSQELGLDVRIDVRTLAFSICLTLLACLLFGTLPAWRATRLNLTPALKEGTTGATGSSPRLRLGQLLVSAQVALSLLLLVGAVLFVRTLTQLAAVDLGFNPERLLTFDTDPGRSGYHGREITSVYQRLQANIATIPGVESVALSEEDLLGGKESDTGVYVPGSAVSTQGNNTLVLSCSASFLSTLRIPVLLGRDLARSDERASERAAVVNQLFVDRFLAGRNPLGQVFYLGDGKPPAPGEKPIRIVGVAKNAHYIAVREELSPIVYTPYTSQERPSGMTFAIRTRLPPLAVAEAVRRVVIQTDRALPVAEMKTETQQIGQSIQTERLFAELVGGFAIVAALLAAIGLYGVMAYTVARRTVEIGIRLALGANRSGVRWLVLRQSLWMVGFGLLLGVPSALALTKLVQKLLFGVTPADPASFVAAVILMATVGAVAAWIPARRASRIDPLTALRCE